MAPQMYPPDGPTENESRAAESAVYHRLRTTLSDEWTVIHSLRWLNLRYGKETKQLPYSQGEIDFVLLHPSLGVHLIEVKGGTWRYNGKTSKFELIRWMQNEWKVLATRDVVGQARTNQFALRDLLQAFCQQLEISTPPFLQVGLFLLFPECDFDRRALPPDIYDPSSGKKLVLGQPEMAHLGDTICAGARIWKESFNRWQGYRKSEIGKELIQRLVAALRPVEGYELRLARQISKDQEYLELRPEQARILSRLLTLKRAIVVGGSGTGKTLLLVEAARRFAEEGQKILVVTFNRLLADRLKEALKNVAKVMTYHEMRTFITSKGNIGEMTKGEVELNQVMKEVLEKRRSTGPPTYNTLLIDEAQSFRPEWIELLVDYYCDARILVCHDEGQIFDLILPEGSFKPNGPSYTLQEELQKLLNYAKPYQLSINLRSPQAVFERLNQIEEPLIQRYSPRPPNPRMLREYVCHERDLFSTVTARLDELADEGVIPEQIVILGKARRLRRMGLANRVSVFKDIRGFRGCEAPVVIVLWMGGSLDSAELRCAYTRATTCTIVLFSQAILCGGAKTQLGQALLADSNCISLHHFLHIEKNDRVLQTPQREEQIVKLRTDASGVVQDGVWLGWLPWEEGAWLLDDVRSSDRVALRLWRDALLIETKKPVYVLKDRLWILYLPPRQEDESAYSSRLGYWEADQLPCYNCGATNVMRLLLPDGNSCCATCWPDKKSAQPSCPFQDQVQQWADFLHTAPSTAQTLLPLSLHALAHWRHSLASPSSYAQLYDNNLPDKLTARKAACRVWLLATLTHLAAGQTFTLAEAQQWLQWNSTNQSKWTGYIGIMLSAISRRQHSSNGKKWVERIQKGVFRRTEAHPARLIERSHYEYESKEVHLWARFFANLDEPAIYDSDVAESTGAVGVFYLPRLELWFVIKRTLEEVINELEIRMEMGSNMYWESSYGKFIAQFPDHEILYVYGTLGEHQGLRYCFWDEDIPTDDIYYARSWNWTIQHGLLAVGNANGATHPRLQMAYQAAGDIEDQPPDIVW